MEKIMLLKAFSETRQREINRQDGSKGIIQWHDIILTDGIDTIMGESSENLTKLIDSPDPNIRLDMSIDCLYNVRANLQVVSYEKNGQKSNFMKASILNMVKV